MARVKLDLPPNFQFQTEIKVRITDLNYGQHVGNDVYLSYMHQARIEYFYHLGYNNEKELDGVGIILSDSLVIYKSEIFYGDILKAEVAAADFQNTGFDLLYRFTSTSTGKEAARGKTGIVCYNYNLRKVSILPLSLKESLLKK